MMKCFFDYENLCIDRDRPIILGNRGQLLGNSGHLFSYASRSYFNEIIFQYNAKKTCLSKKIRLFYKKSI